MLTSFVSQSSDTYFSTLLNKEKFGSSRSCIAGTILAQFMCKMTARERRQPRVPLFGVAEVRAGSDDFTYFCTALIQNISLSGVGLYMHQPIEVGIPVSITIRFTTNNGKRPSDIVEGVVASVTEIDDFFCVGVGFSSPVNSDKQPNLHQHLVSIAGR